MKRREWLVGVVATAATVAGVPLFRIPNRREREIARLAADVESFNVGRPPAGKIVRTLIESHNGELERMKRLGICV